MCIGGGGIYRACTESRMAPIQPRKPAKQSSTRTTSNTKSRTTAKGRRKRQPSRKHQHETHERRKERGKPAISCFTRCSFLFFLSCIFPPLRWLVCGAEEEGPMYVSFYGKKMAYVQPNKTRPPFHQRPSPFPFLPAALPISFFFLLPHSYCCCCC